VRHLEIPTLRGTFTKVNGDVQHFAADPSKFAFDVTIDAPSWDTPVEMRDSNRRSAHFLDTAKYPTITFKSKRVEGAGADKLKVIRNLTINRVTKQVWLDGDGPTPPTKDPRGNAQVGASATTQIKRQDSGVSSLPGMIGDDVTNVIDVELVEPSGKPPPRRLSKRSYLIRCFVER